MSDGRRLKHLGNIGLAALAVATVGAVGYVLVGSAAAPPAPVSSQVQEYVETHKTLAPAVDGLTFAAVGDSVTVGNSPDFAKLKVGDGSWVMYARSEAFPFEGGWAKKGATTAEMLENAAPVTSGTAKKPVEALVIIAGTNDSGQKVPFEESARNLSAIAAKVGAPKVIVSSIPPRDAAPAVAVEYNAKLKPFVESQGWEFVDAMAGVREGDRYKEGMTSDGIHPTATAAQIIGETIRTAAITP